MTGYFVRIERDGKWVTVELDTMTDEELETFFKDNSASTKYAIGLAKWIRNNVGESP